MIKVLSNLINLNKILPSSKEKNLFTLPCFFGSFLVKQRAPREARNPATSEVVKLNERFDPVFKVSKLLKKSVNQSLIRGF